MFSKTGGPGMGMSFFSLLGELMRNSPELRDGFNKAMDSARKSMWDQLEESSTQLGLSCGIWATRMSWRQNGWRDIKPLTGREYIVTARKLFERQLIGAKYGIGESKK
jgi:hypothetical protein